MLPSSHSVLIKSASSEVRGEMIPRVIADRLEAQGGPEIATRQLATAFSDFIQASTRLEDSYRQLQDEVAELRLELAKRNVALQLSLAENERMRLDLEQIVSSMPCGVLVFGDDGDISIANPEGRRLLGLESSTSAVQETFNTAAVSSATGVDLGRFARIASSGEAVQEICLDGVGGLCWLELRVRGLRDSISAVGSAGERTIVILRDITGRKRDEQEREDSRHALALAEASTEVAHEIRNPLASLELFAELIEQDEAQRPLWISHLRAGIRSLSATVNNVLTMQSGALRLDPMNLADVVGDALKFANPLLAQAQLSVVWTASLAAQPVLGCPAAIQQIILNLVTNAIRYTPAGGTVELALCSSQKKGGNATSEWLVLEFADSGSGIPEDQIDRIFEPGFSGSGTTSGLGLAVCERIMREHGGHIKAANRSAGGAQFMLEFPVPVLQKGVVAA